MANLASMLPSVPKSFGRLSEAYLSAFLALQGKSNPLALPSRQSYVVILIDGLGISNIKSAGAHASFLNSQISNSKSLFSGFPTTTATSLASFATGTGAGGHAFLGYRVFDRANSRVINLLNDLGEDLPPSTYQNLETISEQAQRAGLSVLTVGPAAYANSGFTRATMPAAKYLTSQSIEERFEVAKAQLAIPGTLIYLYVPELDQIAHRLGVGSWKWLEAVELLDSVSAKFLHSLPRGAGAILTADHGVIDVPVSSHVYLDGLSSMKDLVIIGGDPRVGYLYFEPGVDIVSKIESLQEDLAGLVDVFTVNDLVEAGWLMPLSETAWNLAPDLVLLPRGNRVVYHRNFASAKALEMVGQHGGLTKAEWEVPCIVF